MVTARYSSVDKDQLERVLRPEDRRRVFEAIGFQLGEERAGSDGWISGILGPSELGEGEEGNFSVNVETGAIRDHGSPGWKGDLWKAVQEVKGADFPGALEWVANLVGYEPIGNDEPSADWNPFTDGQEVEAYRYVEEDGTPVYEVVRFEVEPGHPAYPDKTFRQRQVGPDGRTDWGLGDAPRVLYRLPQVRGAIAEGETVFLVEGEKDVHTLEEIGFVATTNPMGAGKWRSVYTEQLSGADVVIIPDRDEAGRAHAEEVAHRIWETAEEIRILELPGLAEGEDVTDWLKTGRDSMDLMQEVHEAEPVERPDGQVSRVFWDRGDQGGLEIRRLELIRFLEDRGFRKTYLPGQQESTLVRLADNILERTSVEKMKDEVMTCVRNLPDELPGGISRDELEEKLLCGARNYFATPLLTSLSSIELNLQEDGPETGYLYFRNCAVRIRPGEIETLEYEELEGRVWRDQIIDRDFRLDPSVIKNPLETDFGAFLFHVAGDEKRRFKALVSALGYLIHGYKDRSLAKAICFMDETVSDVPSGRSGKSLVGQTLSHVIPTERIGGRNFSFGSRFAFQNVGLDTAVVEFNDVPEEFPFGRLFSMITDDMQVEAKNEDRRTLPFRESPKFLISTNYVIEGHGGSHEDRIHEIEFSDHYNSNHKPVDDFGHRFFEEWDPAQWRAFDNLMIGAVRLFLREGLIEHETVNADFRKLRQETSPEFAVFADRFEPGEEYQKGPQYASFKAEYPEYEDLWQGTFTRWVKTYAQIYNLEYEDRKSGSERYFRLVRSR